MNKLAILLLLPFSFLAQNLASIVNSDNEVSLSKTTNSKSAVQFIMMDAGINSELSEIGSNGFLGKFLIVSNKKRRHFDTTVNQVSGANNNNVFCTDVKKDGKLSFPIIFANVLDSKLDEGNMSYSEVTNTLVYTQQYSEYNNNFKLYQANLQVDCKENWTNITEIKVCDDNHSVITPALNKQGTKLYFSSNMSGGYGGFDLYSADINNGSISNIKNLGSKVNSSKDEKYPNIDPVNKLIYYSSNGFNTFGGYDIFRVSEVANNEFINRVNLGEKVNSKLDELAFVLTSPATGYVSKNKVTDAEDFDIFRFSFIETAIKSKIFIKESQGNVLLPNAKIIVKDEFGKTIFDGFSDEYGCIDLFLMPYGQYTINTIKDGYLNNDTNLFTNDENLKSNIVYLDAKPIEIFEDKLVVENIYFDYNKSTLKQESVVTMNKIAKLLIDRPFINLDILAHTDTKGSDVYNQTLSEKRAKTVYNFLIKNGITPERLTYKGLGESAPVIQCAKCTKDEDSKNRRTEFNVVK
jgi:outer membrane protein OmpA-like peptidoglycan-associated protein